ncbi:hypothetical protein [Ileibacterium valens]|uniref:hypothetical protein n=1 Tax=Ileibacterium valens TaxID=1862668 RepID=UPI002357DE8B|nr:hypothetical protein [Ileibacterium valens]
MAIIKLASEKACQQASADTMTPSDVRVLLSCKKGNESEVVTGKEAGLTLRDYIKNRGWKVLGTNARKYDKFPISIRILSNNNPNMIQVNPDTEKDTFWYILKAATDSVIGFGMAEEISVDQLTSAIQNGTLGDYLRPVQVSQGDYFEVPAGTVYAMDPEIEVLEIQKDGKDITWSANDVISAITLRPTDIRHPRSEWLEDGQARSIHLFKNSVFDVDLVELNGRVDIDADDQSFYVLVFIEGSAVLERKDEILHASRDNCFFVEAGTEPSHITGNCRYITVGLN